jgi:hypothetical protein
LGIENEERDIGRLVHALKRIAAERVCLRDRLLARTHNATPVAPDTDARRRMRAAAERDVENVFGPARRDDQRIYERAPGIAGHASSPGMIFLGRPCCRRH